MNASPELCSPVEALISAVSARGYLTPLSFASLHTLFVWSLVLSKGLRKTCAHHSLDRAPWPFLAGGVTLAGQANLLSAVSHHDVLQLLQSSLHVLTQCLAGSTRRIPRFAG